MRKIISLIILSLSLVSLASNHADEVVIEGKIIGFSDKSTRIITAIECNPCKLQEFFHQQ